MSDNHLKTPLAQSLQRFAHSRARDAIQLTGKSLPCSVTKVVSSGIVKVSFEVNAAPFTLPQVTVPIQYPKYIRYPITVGDLGLVIAADARLGGLTGLGSGVADLSTPANLAALSFVWLGSTKWSDPVEADALQLYDNLVVKPTKLGFFGNTSVTQQNITGALSSVTDPAAKAVLTSIIHALAAAGYNLVTDGTS